MVRCLSSISVLAPVLALALAGGCRPDRDDDDKRTGTDAGDVDGGDTDGATPEFSLSIPAEQREASKYCPAVRPPLPEDPTPPYRFEVAFLNEKLGGDGLTGWIHGAVPMYQQYIFTYRKESGDFMDFFKAEQFSLVPTTPEVAATLASLKRHDKIRLKGVVFQNGSPIVHLKVSGIEIIKKYEGGTDNAYSFDVSKLQGQDRFEIFGQVHATAASPTLGQAIIVEHQDMMMPIAVDAKHDAVAAELYKGDIVNVSVKVVQHGRGPAHFVTDGEVENGIEVVDAMVNCHDLEKTVEGYLVKFDKSPAISTDVYAVRVVDANGIGRNYTFFPDVDMMADPDAFGRIFTEISAKAKATWDGLADEPTVVRNYRAKQRIKVTAKGKINVVSTEQANAQVYLKSANDITFTAVEE